MCVSYSCTCHECTGMLFLSVRRYTFYMSCVYSMYGSVILVDCTFVHLALDPTVQYTVLYCNSEYSTAYMYSTLSTTVIYAYIFIFVTHLLHLRFAVSALRCYHRTETAHPLITNVFYHFDTTCIRFVMTGLHVNLQIQILCVKAQ